MVAVLVLVGLTKKRFGHYAIFKILSPRSPSSLSVLSGKLYFLEIDPVHQKLWPFECMMLKTLNSNFLD